MTRCPRLRLPADSLFPRLIPAQLAKWPSEGNLAISTPISATIVCATCSPTPGRLSSRATAAGTNGAGHASTSSRIRASTRVSVRSSSSQRTSNSPSTQRCPAVSCPANAWRNSAFLVFKRPCAHSANFPLFCSPAANPRSIKRPPGPNTSLATCPSLIFPLSNTFWMRFATAVCSFTTACR